MNDIVVRLEELYALSTNGFNTTTDKAALEAEADTLLTEIERIASDATWKGNELALQSGTGPKVGFGRNGGELEIKVDDINLPQCYMTARRYRALDAKDIAGVTQTAAAHDDRATRTLTTYHDGWYQRYLAFQQP